MSRVTEDDRIIGSTIRRTRLLHGMTQQELAGMLGMCAQQVQKYETGKDRISAGKLKAVANVFKVDISIFFEGMTATKTEFELRSTSMLKKYLSIPDEDIRIKLNDLVSCIAKKFN